MRDNYWNWKCVILAHYDNFQILGEDSLHKIWSMCKNCTATVWILICCIGTGERHASQWILAVNLIAVSLKQKLNTYWMLFPLGLFRWESERRAIAITNLHSSKMMITACSIFIVMHRFKVKFTLEPLKTLWTFLVSCAPAQSKPALIYDLCSDRVQ